MSFRANSAKKVARSYPMIECARCGERLFVPEWTEYIDEAPYGTFGNAKRAIMHLRPPFLMRCRHNPAKHA